MKVDIDLAELHNPLFLGGVNWGNKLLKRQAKGTLELTYDRKEKELIVKFNKFTAIIPNSNVSSMTIGHAALLESVVPAVSHDMVHDIQKAQLEQPTMSPAPQFAPEVKKGPGRPAKVIDSQVSTPHSHVFAGNGGGKIRD